MKTAKLRSSRAHHGAQGVSRRVRNGSLVVATIALLLVIGGYTRDMTKQVEVLATAWRYKKRHYEPPPPDLKVIGITQNFISTLAGYDDQYPFARDIHAMALRRLADAGAKLVVVDVLFSEEGSWELSEDAALRDAVNYCRKHGCKVVLAAAIEVQQIGKGASQSLITPAPTIMEAQPFLGMSNTQPKLSFKLTERVTFDMELKDQGRLLSQPAMAYALENHSLDFESLLADPVACMPGLKPGQNEYTINYLGPPDAFEGYTYDMATLFPEAGDDARWQAVKALRDKRNAGTLAAGESKQLEDSMSLHGSEADALKQVFNGAVVFVGSRNAADNDYFLTPYGQMFGVDTNAQSFDTLERQRFINDTSPWINLLGAVLLALLAWQLALRRPLQLAAFLGALILALLFAFNVELFVLGNVQMPLTLTTGAFAFPFISCAIYAGVAEEASRRRLYDTFSPYLSDELVRHIIADPDLADLGGRAYTGVVMFNDIRAYSTITEHLGAHEIVAMLNLYLGEMSQVIRAHGGFVDKFMGDGLLAFFGGPVPLADTVDSALGAASEMIVALHERVWPRLAELGLPQFKAGIGLHLGEVVMGNIGSEQRKNFTVVGDAVNVAARVEGQTKECGWAVLVTREVRDKAGSRFELTRVGEQMVKGRRQPVELYCLVDPSHAELFKLGGSGDGS